MNKELKTTNKWIWSGFLLIFLLISPAIYTAYSKLNGFTEHLEKIVKDVNVKTNLINQMAIAARKRSISLLKMLNIEDSFDLDDELINMTGVASNFMEARDQLMKMQLTKAEIKALQTQQNITINSTSAYRQTSDYLLNDNYQEAKKLLFTSALPQQNKLLDHLDHILKLLESRAEKELRSVQESRDSAILLISVLTILAIFLGMIVIYYVTRKISILENKQLIINKKLNNTNKKALSANIKAKESKVLAEKANRAKSDFLSCMSHELRTPLNAVIGFTHVLLHDQIKDKKERRSRLVKIHESAKHLLSLINDILDFSKIEAGKLTIEKTTVDLEKVLDSVFTLISEKASEKKLEVVFDISPDIPSLIQGDPLRLGQILLNFSNNAIKFTESGVISIKVSLREKREDDIVLLFEVIDTGLGLTEQQQQRLFKAFEQADESTSRQFGGTGLGLAISKRLANLMGGEVGVSSDFGQGSNFWFTAKFKALSSKKIAEKINSNDIKERRVLVVDDLEEMREIHRKFLENIRVRVDTAKDGNEALEYAAKAVLENDPYQTILIDWEMPDMNGLVTTKKLKKLQGMSATRYILVTGHSQFLMEEESADYFDAILTKPVTASHFYDTLLTLEDPKNAKLPEEVKILSYGKVTNCHILVVEDNLLNQELMSDLLGQMGLIPEIAENGAIALDKIKQRRPDVVLMDLQMPVMGGVETTKAIRKLSGYDDMPIIAMTANAFDEDKIMCFEAGMNSHLSKPVEPNLLYKELHKWCNLQKNLTDHEESLSDDELSVFEHLMRLDELDVNSALIYFAQNKANYLKELSVFTKAHDDDVSKIRECIQSNSKLKQAIRISHTLKGIAATLGMKEIKALAEKVEIALYQQHYDVSIEDSLNQLEIEQQKMLDLLLKILPQDTNINISSNVTISAEDADKILLQIRLLLAEDDFNTRQLMQNHYAELQTVYGKEIVTLKNHIEEYQNSDAIKLLDQIRSGGEQNSN